MFTVKTLLTPGVLVRGFAPALILVFAGCGSSVGTFFDWTIEGAADRRTIQPGQSTTWPIVVRSKNDIENTVRFRVEGVPTGATAVFDPVNLGTTGNASSLTVQTTAETPVGAYSLSVYAEEVGVAEYAHLPLTLIVTTDPGAVDFSLEVTPETFRFLEPGAGPTVTFYVRPMNGFRGTVSLAVSESSPYVYIVQGPTPPSLVFDSDGGQGGTFVIRAEDYPPNAPPVIVTVTASSGAIVHSRTVRVELGPAS